MHMCCLQCWFVVYVCSTTNLSLRQKPTEILLELAAVEPVAAVQCKRRISLELCLDPAFGVNTVV